MFEKVSDKASEELVLKIERHIRLCIKPKPKHLPRFIWEWLLSKMLVMEEFNKEI